MEESSSQDIVSVENLKAYCLRLTFADGTQQTIDFAPLLYGPMFGPLRDLDEFNRVRLNKDTGTIEWPNGADFSPMRLYEWPKHKDRVIAERKQRYIVSAE